MQEVKPQYNQAEHGVGTVFRIGTMTRCHSGAVFTQPGVTIPAAGLSTKHFICAMMAAKVPRVLGTCLEIHGGGDRPEKDCTLPLAGKAGRM